MSFNNLEKKYSLLFTLPKSTTLVLITYLLLLVGITVLSLKILGPWLSVGFFVIGILQIPLVRYIGSFTVPYSSIRRVASAEIFALSPLFFTLIVLELIPHQKLILLHVTLAFITSFRFIVYYGAFFDRISASLITSLLPSLPFFIIVKNPVETFPFFTLLPPALLLILRLDGISKIEFNEKTTSLFKYFMSAWISEYPLPLENFLEKYSEKIRTKVYSIIFKTQNSKPIRLVIPYVHPGPFKPIGSYNLPYEIRKNFPNENVIVVHAPVDHGFDLPSCAELRSFLFAIKGDGERTFGTKISTLKRVKSKNFEALAVNILDNYENHKLIVIINPVTPCEDFPSEFSEKFIGESGIIVVDAHNNIGHVPDDSKVREAEDLIKKVVSNFEWKDKVFIGYSHVEPWNTQDIGPGGVDCITFSFEDGEKFSLIVFDANNMKSGLASKLVSELRPEYGDVIILTTDSHFNAAKIFTEKGYKPLGSETPYAKLLEVCKTLLSLSFENLKPSEIHLIEHELEVKVVGKGLLLRISGVVEDAFNFFKKIWVFLFTTTLFFFLFFGLINI